MASMLMRGIIKHQVYCIAFQQYSKPEKDCFVRPLKLSKRFTLIFEPLLILGVKSRRKSVIYFLVVII